VWISSLSTIPPFPRASSLPATLTDEIKLYNPSAPISLLERIAPVTTIGTSVCTVKSKKYAVSSSVSVPCLTCSLAIFSSFYYVIAVFLAV
jgi:hypothetical protein